MNFTPHLLPCLLYALKWEPGWIMIKFSRIKFVYPDLCKKQNSVKDQNYTLIAFKTVSVEFYLYLCMSFMFLSCHHVWYIYCVKWLQQVLYTQTVKSVSSWGRLTSLLPPTNNRAWFSSPWTPHGSRSSDPSPCLVIWTTHVSEMSRTDIIHWYNVKHFIETC